MAASKNARKRQAPGTLSLQCPKRMAPAKDSPTLTEIEDRASTIRCVYVRRVRTYATRPDGLCCSARGRSLPSTWNPGFSFFS